MNWVDRFQRQISEMHTTMQALGRFAVIGGGLLVALLNVVLFSDVESLTDDAKRSVYASIYLYVSHTLCLDSRRDFGEVSLCPI